MCPYISLVETDSVPDSSSGSSVADEEKYKVGDSYEGDSLKVKSFGGQKHMHC